MTLLRSPYAPRPDLIPAGSKDSPVLRRRLLIADLARIVGATNVRAFYVPSPTEGLIVPDALVPARLWTHGATPAGRIRPLGKGAALTFNGTSDYITTPDAADLSFGTGAADSAFSIVALANVTDSAAVRLLFSKRDTSNREYRLHLDTTDKLTLQLTDESAAAQPFRVSDAAITQAAPTLFGATYSVATGGATAANDMTLYQNGAVIASTATNVGAYVAMENLAAAGEVGSDTAHTANFFSGSLALMLLVAANLTANQHAALYYRCRQEGLVA